MEQLTLILVTVIIVLVIIVGALAAKVVEQASTIERYYNAFKMGVCTKSHCSCNEAVDFTPEDKEMKNASK